MPLVNGHLPRLLVVAGCVLGWSVLAVAATPAEQHEKRETAMKGAGGAMKTMAGAAKGGVVGDEAKTAAKSIETFAQTLPDLFPPGEQAEKSRALPAIWTDPDGWNAKISDFRAAVAGLVAAADAGDAAALGAAVQATGQTCGGCHKAFRAPEK